MHKPQEEWTSYSTPETFSGLENLHLMGKTFDVFLAEIKLCQGYSGQQLEMTCQCQIITQQFSIYF